jgi:pimeloyl-ACP methyl ester carboxylesterase
MRSVSKIQMLWHDSKMVASMEQGCPITLDLNSEEPGRGLGITLQVDVIATPSPSVVDGKSRGSLRGRASPPPIVTAVLIHGGGTTARFWDRLIPHLDGEVLAVDLPGRADRPADLATLSVEDEVASVVADIESSAGNGPITLVAHSSGGLVVPGVVSAMAGRVSSVVLNAALVPAEGGCGIECMKERHRAGLVTALAAAEADGRTITLPGPPGDPEAFRRAYGGDPLDDDTLAFVVDPQRCVEDTVHHYFQPIHWSEAGGVPITYVLNERDRPVPPDTQQLMAQRLPMPVRVIRVDSGHLLPVTSPAVLAGIVAGRRRGRTALTRRSTWPRGGGR